MKIIVEAEVNRERESREAKDTGVGQATMSVDVLGTTEERRHPEFAVGLLMNAFMQVTSAFLENHRCKDCSTYRMYSSILKGMKMNYQYALLEMGETNNPDTV